LKLFFFFLFVSSNLWAVGITEYLANNSAVAKIEQQNYDEALDVLTSQLSGNPASGVLHYNLGNVFYEEGDLDSAKQHFLASEEFLKPEDRSKALFNVGNIDYQKGQYQEAIKNYVSALKLDPNDRDIRRNLELALLQMQNQPPENQEDQDQNDEQNEEEQQQEPTEEEQQEEEKKQQANDILNQLEQKEKEARQKYLPPQEDKLEVEYDW